MWYRICIRYEFSEVYIIGISHIKRYISALLIQFSIAGFPAYSATIYTENCTRTNTTADPDNWSLPKTAVDTQTIPLVAIDPLASDKQPLPVYKLTNTTWMFFGNIATLNEQNRGFNANAGFIVTEDGVIVIDTLGTPHLGRRMLSTIRCITDKPVKYVIVTHNHPDHAYGTAAFDDATNATIITHKGAIEYNHSPTLESSVAYRREMLPNDMKAFTPVKADIYINEMPFSHRRIQLGDEIIDIYNSGSHHSYGDLVIHQVREKILWISDLAFNQRTTYMGDGNSDQILKAQDWLLKAFPDTKLMVPGHGSAQSPPFSMVSRTHDYVKRMRTSMSKAVEDGTSMLDAVQDVDFEDWKDVPLYEMNQKANANFVYREMEKAYFEDF